MRWRTCSRSLLSPARSGGACRTSPIPRGCWRCRPPRPASTLIACAVSALIGRASRDAAAARSFGEVLLTWYTAHVIGMVIVATLMVVARREGRCLARAAWAPPRFRAVHGRVACGVRDRVPAGAVAAAVPRVRAAAAAGVPARLCRRGVGRRRWSSRSSSGMATALDAGPFALVAFAYACCSAPCCCNCSSAPAACSRCRWPTVLSERRRLAVRYRTLADHSRDLVVRMSAEGAPSYVSPAIRRCWARSRRNSCGRAGTWCMRRICRERRRRSSAIARRA